MTSPRTLTLLMTSLMLGAALSGCFQGGNDRKPGNQPGQVEEAIPEFALSREYRLVLDEEAARSLSQDPEDAANRLIQTAWVVRVGQAGEYTLHYTDSADRAQTKTLSLEPGKPVTVPSVGPFSGATLKRGNETVVQRAPTSFDGFTVDGSPIGFFGDDASAATYEYVSDASTTIEVRDLKVDPNNTEGKDGRLDLASISVSIPFDGKFGWTAAKDGSERRFDIFGEGRLVPGSESLLVVTAKGAIENDAGTMEDFDAGVEVPDAGAAVEGKASVWFSGNELVATQNRGGSARFAPTVQLWLTGAAADELKEEGTPPEAQECIGKSRADNCRVDTSELAQNETFPQEARQPFSSSGSRVESEEKIIDILNKLFAQDIGVGDRFTVTGQARESDSSGSYDISFTFEMYAPKTERVTTKAGAFDAMVITQEARFVADVDRLCASSTYDGSTGTSRCTTDSMRDLELNETLSLTTIWLDAKTWQPLKIESTFPLDVDRVLDRVLASVTDEGWEGFPFGRLEGEKIGVKIEGRSRLELTNAAGATRFSPVVGFALASLLAGSANAMAAPFAGGMMGGFPFGMAGTEEAYPVPPPPYGYPTPYPPDGYPYPTATPPTRSVRSLSLTSAGALADGAKEYTVSSASREFYWWEVELQVDGESWYHAMAETCGTAPETGSYTVCEDGADDEEGVINAGDSLTLGGVTSGQQLRVIDVESNSIILVLTIQ